MTRAPILYLTVGYPGSGKTTASQHIHDLTGAVHVWADYERQQMFKNPQHNHAENLALYDELNQRADELLRAGKDVIFDTNFNLYKDREHLRRIAARNGGQVIVIWVTTPRDIARQRATQHSDGQATRVWGNMPVETFDRIARNQQPPTTDEHVITLDGIHMSREYVAQKLQQYFHTLQHKRV